MQCHERACTGRESPPQRAEREQPLVGDRPHDCHQGRKQGLKEPHDLLRDFRQIPINLAMKIMRSQKIALATGQRAACDNPGGQAYCGQRQFERVLHIIAD